MYEKIVDIVFKIVSVLSWLAAILILFKNKVRKTAAEKAAEKEDKKILKNKENQLEKEEELKDMAQFLCDRCGAPVAVSEGKAIACKKGSEWVNMDVCAECYEYLKKRNAEIARIRAEYDAALEQVAQCKKELIALNALEGTENEQNTGDEQAPDRTASASVTDKLGI